MNANRNILDNIMNGAVVCCIGQFDKRETASMARAAAKGTIYKARAPFAGRYGAMKTYFAASADAFARYQAAQTLRFDTAVAMDQWMRVA